MIRLLDVYKTRGAAAVLFALLREREKHVSISHYRMPTMRAHLKFVRSRPYKSWYLVLEGKDPVGAAYLSRQNEIGFFIFKKYRNHGFGKKALALLMKKYAGSKRFLANISPRNRRSIYFFERLGFRHIQNTYELRKG